MSYRVFWSPHAEQRLEQILQRSKEPRALAAVAVKIDRLLTTDASQFGESRFDTVRVAFVRPLGVQFDVLEDVQTAIVYDVWRIDGKTT